MDKKTNGAESEGHLGVVKGKEERGRTHLGATGLQDGCCPKGRQSSSKPQWLSELPPTRTASPAMTCGEGEGGSIGNQERKVAKLGCGEGAEGASTPLSVPAALFFSVVSLGSSMLEGGERGRSDGTTVWTWSQLSA